MSQGSGVGRKIGHFRLLEQVGAGGMGVVYRAHDEHLDRDVAIKILPPGSLADENKRKWFKQEALALAKLNHPNIAAIYDFDSDGDAEFLVMELLSGKSLADKLEAGPLSENQVVDFGMQMCEGLSAAHQQGILHRDLKPANLGLSADGRLKILDFGLAKLLHSSPSDLTGSITQAPLVGTLRYMAPEQLNGDNIDARADIYAAGTVLYEMASGKRPFHDESGAALINSILNQSPIPPAKLAPPVSSSLSAIILKALEKDPSQRYSSAQELLADLRRLGAGDRSVALQQASQVRRRKLVLAISGIIVVVLAAVLAWRTLYRGQAGPVTGQRPMILVGDFENRTGEPVFDSSLREMFTASLEQSRRVQVFPFIRLADVLRRMNQPGTKAIDEKTGVEICQRENLQGVLLGSIVRLGKKYVVMARIEAPSGTPLASAEASTESPDGIPGRVDEIAETLRHNFGESLQSVKENSVPLAKVTSSSLEAIRYFTLGKQSHLSGDRKRAVLMFSKAVELDPNFAMAHEHLGVVYTNLNDLGRANEQIRQAALLADRVSEPERLRIMGAYYSTLSDYKKECETYELLMQLEPQDPVPYINLADCESEEFNFAAAVDHAEKALGFLPQSVIRINLASILLRQGNAARALELAESFRRDFAEDLFAQTVLARAYLALGRMEEAREVFKNMLQAGGDSEIEGRLYLGDLAMAGGQYREADSQFKAAVFAADKGKNPVGAARIRGALAELLLAENSPAAPVRELLARVDLPLDVPNLNFLMGKMHAWVGQFDLANKDARAIDLLIQKNDVPALQAFRFLLTAEIALAQKQFSDAVNAAETAVQYDNSVFAIETLARCYAAAGMNTQAAQRYEEMLNRANELVYDYHSEAFDAPALRRAVESHYHLGVLYQKLGRVEDARAHLQKFLEYWSHADGTVALYKDAQRLLLSLPSSGTPTPAT